MNFELISPLIEIEPVAVAGRIREVERLRDTYGAGRWRKLKGSPPSALRTAPFGAQKFTGTRPTAPGARN